MFLLILLKPKERKNIAIETNQHYILVVSSDTLTISDKLINKIAFWNSLFSCNLSVCTEWVLTRCF